MTKVKYSGKIDLIYNERMWKSGEIKEVSEAEAQSLIKQHGFELEGKPVEQPKEEIKEEVEGVEE